MSSHPSFSLSLFPHTIETTKYTPITEEAKKEDTNLNKLIIIFFNSSILSPPTTKIPYVRVLEFTLSLFALNQRESYPTNPRFSVPFPFVGQCFYGASQKSPRSSEISPSGRKASSALRTSHRWRICIRSSSAFQVYLCFVLAFLSCLCFSLGLQNSRCSSSNFQVGLHSSLRYSAVKVASQL